MTSRDPPPACVARTQTYRPPRSRPGRTPRSPRRTRRSSSRRDSEFPDAARRCRPVEAARVAASARARPNLNTQQHVTNQSVVTSLSPSSSTFERFDDLQTQWRSRGSGSSRAAASELGRETTAAADGHETVRRVARRCRALTLARLTPLVAGSLLQVVVCVEVTLHRQTSHGRLQNVRSRQTGSTKTGGEGRAGKKNFAEKRETKVDGCICFLLTRMTSRCRRQQCCRWLATRRRIDAARRSIRRVTQHSRRRRRRASCWRWTASARRSR